MRLASRPDASVRQQTEPVARGLQPSGMSAFANAQTVMPQASRPLPALRGKPEPAEHAGPRTTAQRLSVWDERARKMGYPPSLR
jgi:hypothetical protein